MLEPWASGHTGPQADRRGEAPRGHPQMCPSPGLSAQKDMEANCHWVWNWLSLPDVSLSYQKEFKS